MIVGGGGHGRACIDVVESTADYCIEGIVDRPEKRGRRVLGYPVIADDDGLRDLVVPDRCFLIGLGQIGPPGRRKVLYRLLRESGAALPPIVAASAVVSAHARLGAGTIVMHQAVVNAGAVVGDNCIVNTHALVEHDATIGDHCHLSTAAVINGGCRLGDDVFVGSNSTLKQGLVIAAGTVVSAGQFIRSMGTST